MKYFIAFWLVLALLRVGESACTSDEIPFVLKRIYQTNANQESIAIWKGPEGVGSLKYTITGETNYATELIDICLKPELYTFVLSDSSGTGWGTSSAVSLFVVLYKDAEVFWGNMPYTSSGYSKETISFIPNLVIPTGISMLYTNIAQNDQLWTLPAYDSSSWNTAITGSLPTTNGITRYYRFTPSLPNIMNSMYSLNLYIIHDAAFIVYINGVEIYRYKIIDPITSSSTADAANDATAIYRYIEIPMSSLNTTSPVVISIETHQFRAESNRPDLLNLFAFLNTIQTNQCSFSRMDVSTASYSCSTAAYSSTYACSKAFDSCLTSYFYTSKPQTDLIWRTKNYDAIYVTSYTITTASTTSYGNPSSWKLYGSNDEDNTYFLLDHQEGIIFAGMKTTLQFFLRSNHVAYKKYKLSLLTGTISSKQCIGDFTLYSCNNDNMLPDGLYYPSSSINAKIGMDIPVQKPISTGYTHFEIISSAVPGLILNEDNGYITGTLFQSGIINVTIRATNDYTQINYNTTITFNVEDCSQPTYQPIKIVKTTKSTTTDSFQIISSSNAIVYESEPFTANSISSISLCLPADLLTIQLKATSSNGWTSLSNIMIYTVLDKEYIPLARSTIYKKTTFSFTIDTRHIIPLSSTWKLMQNTIPTEWYLPSYSTNTWIDYISSSSPPIQSTSNKHLFRYTILLDSLMNQQGFVLYFKAKSAYIIYINGIEYTRGNLSDGPFSSTSEALSGDINTIYRTVKGPISVFNKNINNVIAIGLINLGEYNNIPINFDCILFFEPFTNVLSNTFDITPFGTHSTQTNNNILYDESYSNTAVIRSIRGEEAILGYTLNNNRCEYFNKYCIWNAANGHEYDPNDWSLMGSYDGIHYITIANETNVKWLNTREQKCFYIYENTGCYQSYQIVLHEPWEITEDYIYYLTELSFFNEDFSNIIIPPFDINPKIIETYQGIEFPTITESDDIYRDYTISPSLPEGLELDSTTGNIRGSTIQLFNQQFILSAKNHKGEQSSVTITIRCIPCTSPNSLLSLYLESGSTGNEMGFILSTKTDTVIVDKSKLYKNGKMSFHFCRSDSMYKLQLLDSENDGWNGGHYKILINNNTLYQEGTVENHESPKIILIQYNYIYEYNTILWQYTYESQDQYVDWTTSKTNNNNNAIWLTSLSSTLPSTNSITQYYKFPFTVSNEMDTKGSAIKFSFTIKGGYILYMNGYELVRVNMPEQVNITSSTYAIKQSDFSISVYVYGTQFGWYKRFNENILAIEVHKIENNIQNELFDCSIQMILSDNSIRSQDGSVTSDINIYDTSSYNNVNNLFDHSISNMIWSGPRCVGAEYTYHFNNERYEYINTYTLFHICDCFKRIPSGWEIRGSNDNSTWDLLDTQYNQIITYCNEVNEYTFYNQKSYKYIQFYVTECNNQFSNPYDANYCNVGPWGSQPGFAVSELYYKTTIIINACSRTEDGYEGTVHNSYSYKSCPELYQGTYKRKCFEGQFLNEENNCIPKKPSVFRYPARIISMTIGQAISPLIPTIIAAEYTCTVEPPLPKGMNIDSNTCIITGSSEIELTSASFTVSCITNGGVKTYDLVMNAEKVDYTNVILWIVLAIILLIIVIVLILCILNRMKKSNTHLKMKEKVSSNSTNAKNRKNSSKTVKI
ncbi:hypothetical protein WA158_006897 [Blastocystis sp. Blastoise]